jgi:hypothetical protein
MKKKLLKTAMISAVAFTPVLAVGVNVDKASAATTDIQTDYMAMSVVEKEILNDSMAVFAQTVNTGKFVQATLPVSYTTTKTRNEFIQSLSTLLAPLPSDSATISSDLQARFTAFENSFPVAASADAQVLSPYLEQVATIIADEVEKFNPASDQVDVAPLFNTIKNRLMNEAPIPVTVEDYIKYPSTGDAASLVDQVNAQVQDTPPGPGPGPVTPPTEEPPVDNGNGEISTGGDTVENNPQQVIDAINAADTVDELVITLEGTDTEVAIPGTIFNALENKNSDAVIIVETSTGSYELPVSAVDLEALAEQLNVTTAELKIVIKVSEVQAPGMVNAQYDVILPSIDFEVTVVAPNGESIVLNFFPQPVKRSITATKQLAALTTVGVIVVNGQVRGVPTFVTPGNTTANLYRAGNSTYTLVENFKTFKDVNNGANWSEQYVEKLASRLIVSGTTAETYSPNRSITRGEFASILSRGLGLVAKNPNVTFSDVSSTQAFNRNAEIAAVVEAGIVNGYKDGKFRPYQEINRGEAAIMISKALEYYGADLVTLDKTKKASNFEDYRYIGTTTRPHIEKVLQAGYINGYSDGSYKSSNDASRAEMARILYDFLNSIEFIN